VTENRSRLNKSVFATMKIEAETKNRKTQHFGSVRFWVFSVSFQKYPPLAGCMDGTMLVTVFRSRPLFRRSRRFGLKIGARAQPCPYNDGPPLQRPFMSSSRLFMFSSSSIDIYLCLLCILMFGSNIIVGQACSREGRAGEAGSRGTKALPRADATDARGHQ
jgi:hypothetical protein